MTRFSFLLPAIMMSIVLAPRGGVAAECTSALKPADLVKPGTLVMSTNPTLPPLQYVDKSGQLVGMRIELGPRSPSGSASRPNISGSSSRP